MKIDEKTIAFLGQVILLGQIDEADSLWALTGRATRVPRNGYDEKTPGVFSLRTLVVRSGSRNMKGFDVADDYNFVDPALLDFFASAAGKEGQAFTLNVLGLEAKVKLAREARTLVQPAWEHPGFVPASVGSIAVPPYVLAEGSLAIVNEEGLEKLLPDVDLAHPIELRADGIVYTAAIVPPDGGSSIPTRVRLTLRQGKAGVGLLNPQPASSDVLWRQLWLRMNAIGRTLRVTAWARLTFSIDVALPELAWPAKVKNKRVTADWADVVLQAGIAQITLADQPLESQVLGPEQVLELAPAVRLQLKGGTLVVSSVGAAAAAADADAEYSWNVTQEDRVDQTTGGTTTISVVKEFFSFAPMLLVHEPTPVRGQLALAYGREMPASSVPVVGFIQLENGWLEVPVEGDLDTGSRLPAVVERTDAKTVRGSFLLGNRRHEFHAAGEVPASAPWSLQLDEPPEYSVEFTIDLSSQPRLTKARMGLSGFALESRGLAWMANCRPDANDALPMASDHPGAYFDVVLRRCVGVAAAAPFGVSGLVVEAQQRPGAAWNDAARAQDLQPVLAQGLVLHLNPSALAPNAPTQRAWLRHPTLPSMQVMCSTRSDPTSTLPHASRSLTPFERLASPLALQGPASMLPRIAASDENSFLAKLDAKKRPEPLVALTLPGVELLPLSPSTYGVSGDFEQPLYVEPHALAVIPPPDKEPSGPGQGSAPLPPVITTLEPERLEELRLANWALRERAATQDSSMFPRGEMGKPINVTPTTLAPPFSWAATIQIDPEITIKGSRVTFGRATFSQKTPVWSDVFSGDSLLEGPRGRMLKINGATVSLDPAVGRLLVGWSVREAASGGYVWDARGVGWAVGLTAQGRLISRALQLRDSAGNVTQGSLIATQEAISVSGVTGVAWRLAFTDLPMAGKAMASEAKLNPVGRFAAAASSWTWSLWAPGEQEAKEDRVIRALPVSSACRFMPSELASLVLKSAGALESVAVEGVLVAGNWSRAVASDALRRVTVQMTANTQGNLSITDVKSVHADRQIVWDLETQAADASGWGGVAQLIGTPALRKGVLWMDDARLVLSIFQRSFELALPAPIDTRQTAPSIVSFAVPSDDLGMHVSKIELDLANARVLSVTLAGSLRQGVDISVEHRWDEKKSSGQVQWFGNQINWDASVDGTRGACVLANPSSVDAVTIFPGVAEGRIKDGLVALSIGAGVGPRLEVQSHFFELRFLQRGELTVAHLLQSGGLLPSERDTLRFDGNWTHDSLIGWSNIQGFEFPDGADSVPVEFACPSGAVVRHQIAFELFDHRIPGANIELALNAGIRLKSAGGEAPPTWVVEATHTLTWPEQPNDSYRIRALHALQLWSAQPLAKSLDAMLWKFGFVPGYMGSKYPTPTFPRPGVQRIHLGYIGLFDKSIVAELKTLADSWVILGGMTTLVREQSINYGLLHVPFIAAVCTPGAAAGVQKLLMPPQTPAKGTTLKMSRYDVLDLPVTTEAALAVSPADLVDVIDLQTIPFAQALLPSSLLSGAAMSGSWFADSEPYLPGWHVEQIQRPGATDKKDPLPHPFARAAVMLAMLRKNAPSGVQETLSVLTRYGPRAQAKTMSKPQRLNVSFRSVKLQPILETQPKGGTNPGGDLVIGGEGGLVALPVSRADLDHEDPKHLIGLAIRQMVEPAFLIIRRAEKGATFARCELPAKQMDPLDFSVRALRTKAVHKTDGHLTWPDAFTGGHLSKADLAIAVDERAPEHFAAPIALAALSGRMRTTRPMGLPFGLQGGTALEQTHTVWIEERDRVAYIRPPEQRADAAPWMQDAAVACLPLVPSTREISRAIVQMDPSMGAQQGRRFQTYLPVVADTLDFSSRAGANVEMGVRVLSSRNSVHRQFEQADGGTGITRGIRRPRPVSLPDNSGYPSSWRRTVGWWRDSAQSCQALLGAWDSLSGPPDVNDSSPPEHREVPRWSVLLGKAVPSGLTQETRGAAPIWRGAVTVTCSVWDGDKLVSDPALVVLGLLTTVHEESLRTGLRLGARWIDFERVKVVGTRGPAGQDRLVFLPPAGALPVTDGDCVFECGFHPRMVDLPAGTMADLQLKVRARETLDRADFRLLALPVLGPVQGRFPIPLVRRTVFFSDPAFDLRLSKIEPLSVNQAFNKEIPDRIFNAWIDRQSVTPNETAVVRVTTNWRDGKRSFFLTARTIHKSDGSDEALDFDFGAGGVVLGRVPLAQDEYYALPTSVLKAAKGGLLRAGDTLVLQVQAVAMDSENAELIARLLIPIKSKTVLPPPQAMYSLVALDAGSRPAPLAWCSAHSALPTPESMSTDVVRGAGDASAPARIIRRGIFKWVSIDPVTPDALGYSVLKAERITESTHVPETIEKELRP